jgi:hypothetical protein
MSHFLPSQVMPRMMRAALAGFTVVLVAAASAQARPAGGSSGDDSKLEIYGGYGFWHPVNSGINGYQYPEIYNPNATASLSYYFSRHLGIQAEGSYFSIGRTLTPANVCNASPCSPVGQRVYTAEAGPVFRYPMGRLIPFAHVLGGGEKMSGPYYNRLTWGWGVTGGVGVDYVLPYFHNLIALRPVQADFQYSEVDYGPLVLPAGVSGGQGNVTALKLSGGLVLRFGGSDMTPSQHGGLTLDCDVDPSSLYSGDPVQVSAHPLNLKKRPSSFTWSSTGGRVMESPTGATISTVGLAPGDYTVTGTLVQGKEHAQCSANFTVKAYEPPTVSCSADPAVVQSGGVATITATASSPSNRTLTYAFSSDSGQITGTGNRVQLATAGVSAATVNVTCNVVDDLGKTASATTSVRVKTSAAVMPAQAAGPLPPPLADTQALCGVSFERDHHRPVRVDNEAKACLDDIALTMQRQADAKLVIVGNFGSRENATEGAERSLNVRQYLTDEKGIDIGRIEVRYGDASGRSVDDVLVPSGSTYSNDKTTAFDPASVKRVGQAYGRAGQHPYGRSGQHQGSRRIVRRHKHHHHPAAAQVPAPPQ